MRASGAVGQLPGQISIEELMSTVSDVRIQEPWKGGYDQILEAVALEGSHNQDGRIRIYAMMVSGEWKQFREKWIKDEYGMGGFSMRFAPGWYADFGPTGMHCKALRKGKEWGYTWRTMLSEIERLIRQDVYLTHEEEKKVERIIMERGHLPYPRARMAYPECAWEESAGGTIPYQTRQEPRRGPAMRPKGARYGKKVEVSGNDDPGGDGDERGGIPDSV